MSFKIKIKNLREAYFTDRQHDKWVNLVGRYYREVLQDPDKTEIYLHKLLNRGFLDKEAAEAVSEEKKSDALFEYNYLKEEGNRIKKRNIYGMLKFLFKEIMAEIEKYSRIISHRKN